MNFDDVAREWDNEKRIERAKIIANKIKTIIPVGKDKLAYLLFIMKGDKI